MNGMTDENVIWRFKNGHEPLGPFGERLWTQVFNQCGFLHVPLATLPVRNGKGPRLQGSDDVLPDFEVTTMGIDRQRVYIDSKCKSHPVFFVKGREWRHGIDKRNYQHYDAIAGMHKQKCLLGIVELFRDEENREWSGTLLVNSLGRLGVPFDGFSSLKDLVLWPRSRFYDVGRYEPSRLFGLAYGNNEALASTKKRLTDAFVIRRETIQTRLW